jgi:hypothetical protein
MPDELDVQDSLQRQVLQFFVVLAYVAHQLLDSCFRNGVVTPVVVAVTTVEGGR